MRKFIVEFGMGTDFHGQSVTKAACKAVKDAVSRSCLCGLEELIDQGEADRQVLVQVQVAVSRPEDVDLGLVASMLPVGKVEVQAVSGGLCVEGLCIPQFGDSDKSIEAALAAVTVFIP